MHRNFLPSCAGRHWAGFPGKRHYWNVIWRYKCSDRSRVTRRSENRQRQALGIRRRASGMSVEPRSWHHAAQSASLAPAPRPAAMAGGTTGKGSRQRRGFVQLGGTGLLVRGFLDGLLLAPGQPGLVLFRQFGDLRFWRSIFLLHCCGGCGRSCCRCFADGPFLVFLILLLTLLGHIGRR